MMTREERVLVLDALLDEYIEVKDRTDAYSLGYQKGLQQAMMLVRIVN